MLVIKHYKFSRRSQQVNLMFENRCKVVPVKDKSTKIREKETAEVLLRFSQFVEFRKASLLHRSILTNLELF